MKLRDAAPLFVATLGALAVLSASARVRACSGSGAPPAARILAAGAPDVFGWWDVATAVGEARVTHDPGFTLEGHGKPGLVELAFTKRLKGTPPKVTTLQQTSTPCGGYSTGLRRVVFLDAEQHVLGVAPLELEPALAAYGAADATERTRLIAKWAAEPDSLRSGAARKRAKH